MNEEIRNNEISEEELENVSGGSDYMKPVNLCRVCGRILPSDAEGAVVCIECSAKA